jgi:hypothetical protein
MSRYIKTGGEIRKDLDKAVEKIPFSNTLNKQWISLSRIQKFIDEHTVTKPAGKLIRFLPYEWKDFLGGKQ